MPDLATTSNGKGRRSDGRFADGNTAARRHGLRAGSRTELRRQSRRVGRLQAVLVEAFAKAGRPLAELSLPKARKWAELEVLRVDRFAALQGAETANGKVFEEYAAVTRLQLVVERDLGMTPALRADVAGIAEGLAEGLAMARRRLEEGTA